MPLRNAMYVLMFIPMSTPVFATALGLGAVARPARRHDQRLSARAHGQRCRRRGRSIFTVCRRADFRSCAGHGADHVAVSHRGVAPHGPGARRGRDRRLARGVGACSKTITAPLMRPGWRRWRFIFFLTGLEALELPLALGPTAGIEVLSTKIFFSLAPTGGRRRELRHPCRFRFARFVYGHCWARCFTMRSGPPSIGLRGGERKRLSAADHRAWANGSTWGSGAHRCLFVVIKVILPFAVLALRQLSCASTCRQSREYLPDIKMDAA